MYKKAWCTCKLVVLRNKASAFLTFYLPSQSSLLKLPINLAKTCSRMTTATTFSRQNNAGSRASTTYYWENLVLTVVLRVLESKGQVGCNHFTILSRSGFVPLLSFRFCTPVSMGQYAMITGTSGMLTLYVICWEWEMQRLLWRAPGSVRAIQPCLFGWMTSIVKVMN